MGLFHMDISGWRLNSDSFVELLGQLVNEGEHLQNWPSGGYIPEEDRAADHILKRLAPFCGEGGPLAVEHVHLNPVKHPRRGNIIIRYPAQAPADSPSVSFVGSHMDVVFANPEHWERHPFTFSRDGDKLFGRGTTDCLGHCTLLTELFVQLATEKPDLNGLRVIGVIICDEESGGSSGEDMVGVEGLQKHHHMDDLVHGPVIWLDCADKQPNVGSGGMVQWALTARGKLTHSGFPHKAINAVELGTDALVQIQKDFYQAFPVHEQESVYGFESTSSFKPTRVTMPDGGINQIPGDFTMQGDVRLIPFYRIEKACQVLKESVERLNQVEELEKLQGQHGPDSKYVLRDEEGQVKAKGSLEMKFLCDPVQGIACSLDSPGFQALAKATEKVVGHVKPLADTGTLPLVADLKDAGFDVQTVGYGVEDVYHADNEYALLSDFEQGYQVLCNIITDLVPRSN